MGAPVLKFQELAALKLAGQIVTKDTMALKVMVEVKAKDTVKVNVKVKAKDTAKVKDTVKVKAKANDTAKVNDTAEVDFRTFAFPRCSRAFPGPTTPYVTPPLTPPLSEQEFGPWWDKFLANI
jgi:hypothetical protein